MKSGPLGLVLALGLSLPAQDGKPAPAAAGDLPRLRAAFAALPVAIGPVIAIACTRGGEPVILTRGTDAGGKELSPETLLPLLALAKLVAADAIHAQYKGKLDVGSGERLGGRELSVRELLDGTELLPDYFVLDGGQESVDAAMLRACGDCAAGAKVQLRPTTLGMAEFVLLERLAFGDRYKDWPSMLRSTLSPHVPGLDPVSAEGLGETARSRLLFGAEDVAKLATARPALLRTLLSLKDLGTWWQWRSRQDALLWSSARMGRAVPTRTRPTEKRWGFQAAAMNLTIFASQYPTKEAGLLWFGVPPAGGSAMHRMTSSQMMEAFEADVFGDADGSVAAGPVVGGLLAAAAAPAPPVPVGGTLGGSRWRSAPLADGTSVVRLTFGTEAKEAVVLTLGKDSTSFGSVTRSGDGLLATARAADGGQRSLWLWPQPDADKPAKLGAIVMTTRLGGGTGGPIGSAVPQFVELVPEAK